MRDTDALTLALVSAIFAAEAATKDLAVVAAAEAAGTGTAADLSAAVARAADAARAVAEAWKALA